MNQGFNRATHALAAALMIGGGCLGAAQAQDAKAVEAAGWAMYGRGYDNTRFSPLKQITSANVGKLKLAFSFQLGSLRSNEASPIVVGDTMYVSTSWGPKFVYALDARTGATSGPTSPRCPTTRCSTPAAT